MEKIKSEVLETLNGTIFFKVLTQMNADTSHIPELEHELIQPVTANERIVGELNAFEVACLQVAFDMAEEHEKLHQESNHNIISCFKYRTEIDWLVDTVECSVRTRIPELADSSSVVPGFRSGNQVVVKPKMPAMSSLFELIMLARM